MDTEVFLRLPKGVNIVDVNDSNRSTDNELVLRLWKSLYGLKQAGQLWNQELDRFFISIGFKRCDAETCLYARHDSTTGNFVLVLSEVNDSVVTGNDDDFIQHFRDGLIDSFASKNDDGTNNNKSITWKPLSSFLGLAINYDAEAGVLSMNIKT
jgi:hypothetical protein